MRFLVNIPSLLSLTIRCFLPGICINLFIYCWIKSASGLFSVLIRHAYLYYFLLTVSFGFNIKVIQKNFIFRKCIKLESILFYIFVRIWPVKLSGSEVFFWGWGWGREEHRLVFVETGDMWEGFRFYIFFLIEIGPCMFSIFFMSILVKCIFQEMCPFYQDFQIY